MVNHNQRIDGMGHPELDLREHHVLHACDYEHLYENNRTYNLTLFGPVVHVKLDLGIHSSCRLLSIYESETLEAVGSYTYDELGRPWVDIMVDLLNTGTGLHTYTMEFVNLITSDTYYQYFNYTIQNDAPEKPYIYMER